MMQYSQLPISELHRKRERKLIMTHHFQLLMTHGLELL